MREVCAEGLRRFVGLIPVTLRHVWPSQPDFTDLSRPTLDERLWMSNHNLLIENRAAATHEAPHGIVRSCRRHDGMVLSPYWVRISRRGNQITA